MNAPTRLRIGILAVLFLLPTLAFATEVPSSTAPSAESAIVLLITTLSASCVALVTIGVKKVLPGIPRIMLPTIVIPTLSVLAELLPTYATGGKFSPIVAALIAAGAVWVRESVDTAKKHGLDPIEKQP